MAKDKKEKKFKLNDDVKEFSKITLKKFKKREGDFYDKKKELKAAYYEYLLTLLPETIWFLIRYGHMPENKETRDAVLVNFNDPDFTKYLIDALKDEIEIKNIEMVPAIINDILIEYAQLENKSGEQYDVSGLIKLSKMILKKKLKKMDKAGIPETLAFDLLSVIPDTSVINKNPFYRMKTFMNVLYVSSAKNVITAETLKNIVDIVFKDDEKQRANLLLYIMRERSADKDNLKEDAQKTFWDETKKFVLNELSEMKKKEIEEVLKIYIDSRETDVKSNKDCERKIKFADNTAITGKVAEVVERIVENNDAKKKFLA